MVGAGGDLQGEVDADCPALDRLASTDDTLCFVIHLMFDRLHSLNSSTAATWKVGHVLNSCSTPRAQSASSSVQKNARRPSDDFKDYMFTTMQAKGH